MLFDGPGTNDRFPVIRSYSTSTGGRRHAGYQRLDPAAASLWDLDEQKNDGMDSVAIAALTLASPAVRKAADKSRSCSKTSGLAKDAAAKTPHPLLNFFNASRRNKKAAKVKPELMRYLEYMKEGGTWDPNSNRPVIHFK